MRCNDAGLNLIKSFEGCKLTAYQDQGGVWTIGFGSTGHAAYKGNSIDQTTADVILCEDLGMTEEGVAKRLRVKVNENQFSAMVCLAFNIGLGNFGMSTLLKKVNSGDFKGAASEFERWTKIQRQVSAGLTRRRKAERALFIS